MWWKKRRQPATPDPFKEKLNHIEEQLETMDKAVARLLREQTKAQFSWESSLQKQTDTILAELKDDTTQQFLPQLMAFLDDLLQAANALETQGEQTPALMQWAQGMQRLHRQGEQLLENWNVKPLSAVGLIFDPQVHQPIHVVISDKVNEPVIIEEIQRGYQKDGQLLRQATVVVAKPPQQGENEP